MKDLRKLREEQGLSQRKLAKKSGISQSAISKLECHKTKVSYLHTIENLAFGLGINVSDLLVDDT